MVPTSDIVPIGNSSGKRLIIVTCCIWCLCVTCLLFVIYAIVACDKSTWNWDW